MDHSLYDICPQGIKIVTICHGCGEYNCCIHRAHDILKTWLAMVHTMSHIPRWLVSSQFNLLQNHLFFQIFVIFYIFHLLGFGVIFHHSIF